MFEQTSKQRTISFVSGAPLPRYPMNTVADVFPAVPITLVTRLRLELLVMRSSTMDLKVITETILKDAGATLQLLRVVGEEYGTEEWRPSRVEHCIASLDCERWFGTVCATVVTSQSSEVYTAWQQFYSNAQHSRLIALGNGELNAEEAYIVGLLHQIGRLPKLLGWMPQSSYTPAEERELGSMLARQWCLPSFLIEALEEQQQGICRSGWSALLHAARKENSRQEYEPNNQASASCGELAFLA